MCSFLAPPSYKYKHDCKSCGILDGHFGLVRLWENPCVLQKPSLLFSCIPFLSAHCTCILITKQGLPQTQFFLLFVSFLTVKNALHPSYKTSIWIKTSSLPRNKIYSWNVGKAGKVVIFLAWNDYFRRFLNADICYNRIHGHSSRRSGSALHANWQRRQTTQKERPV